MQDNDKLNQLLNYLNMIELKLICIKYNIPFYIYLELDHGKLKKTSAKDRKGIILKRLKHFIKTRKILKPTVFPKKVINNEKISSSPSPKHKIFYSQYKNKSQPIYQLLKKLTQDQFEFGAISQILLRDFWIKGIAPTYQQFAIAWLKAKAQHVKPNEEWAYLTDLSNGADVKNWKSIRKRKAKEALKLLYEQLEKNMSNF